MKAEELRKGNLISDGFCMYKVGNVEHKIVKGFSTIDGKNFYPDTCYSLNEENLQGVSLTKEWLLKLGFYSQLGRFYSQLGHIHFDTGMRLYRPSPCQKIIYVHQLQNLYFALTGEELEVKS